MGQDNGPGQVVKIVGTPTSRRVFINSDSIRPCWLNLAELVIPSVQEFAEHTPALKLVIIHPWIFFSPALL
jgi:hypothetical protein